jgi:hypothetical protein
VQDARKLVKMAVFAPGLVQKIAFFVRNVTAFLLHFLPNSLIFLSLTSEEPIAV